jgi:dTDP-4-amino-4,6-dideoxygalactose transaminase
VCRRGRDHARAKALKWFGIDRDAGKDENGNWKGQQWDVDVEEAGYKFNMNNVAAAIGLSQFPHIQWILDAHRENARLYDELFTGAGVVRPVTRPIGGRSSAWVYTMRVAEGGIPRDELLCRLHAEKIMAGVVHVPNDTYTAFREYRVALPGTRAFGATQFSLPCGWWLGEEDIRHIAGRVLALSR